MNNASVHAGVDDVESPILSGLSEEIPLEERWSTGNG